MAKRRHQLEAPYLSLGEAVMTVFLKCAVSARIGLPDRLSDTRRLSEDNT